MTQKRGGNPRPPKGAVIAQKKRMDRYFNGLPLKDATFKVAFQVAPEDITDASPADPEQCAVARCFRRIYNSQTAIILRRVAYIQLTDMDGVEKVFRFMVPIRTTKKVILPLDVGGTAEPGTYYLNPPPPTDQMGPKADYMRTRKHAINAGTWVPSKPGPKHMGPRERHIPGTVGTLRDGQGLIHNTFEK